MMATNSKMAYDARRGDLNALAQDVKTQVDASNKAVTDWATYTRQKNAERARERQIQMQERRLELAEEAAARKVESAASKKGGLSKKAEDDIAAKSSLLKQYDKLIAEYESNPVALSQSLRNSLIAAKSIGFEGAGERLLELARANPAKYPNAIAVAEFISKLEKIIAPDRHSLYGANLTKNELPRYERTIPTITDSPETFIKFLKNNRDSVQEALNSKLSFYRGRGVDIDLASAYESSSDFSRSYKFSPQDQAALNWANANPSDPRSKAIKNRLGVSE